MAARLGSIASSSVASRSSTTLITPQILALSETVVPQVDAHLWDYLNIEMQQIVMDAAAHAQARNDIRRGLIERELQQEYNITTPSAMLNTNESTNGMDGPPLLPVDSSRQLDEASRVRLESIGYRLGWTLAERLAKERAPIAKQAAPAQSTSNSAAPSLPGPITALEPLEVVKFVCKDVWVALYDKQIDNLRTNHRGVFVLQDNALKPLVRLSVSNPNDPVLREAGIRRGRQMLGVPTGIIRGALAVLGLHTTITVDYNGGSQCVFQVKTIQKA